ncbi:MULTISPECIES: hypothetical protein [unclassified Marinobacterium]|jgi:hypothetical protein|uniref:hypothetical protein n=1 Tax=unclassified Marinobacterium TaxID=2644139 RepID=UPI00156A3E3F|nr:MULTISPECIES: hypothetical protein [unclassified Marinobacterium]NRP58360.1 hypothetical protein [Marinobacterium sp. xm-d-510]NRP98509.1 hypothetical protein [Marinobacterium sp. xm-a-127]
MTKSLRDLINLSEAASTIKLDVSDLLFNALEGKLDLFTISTSERTLDLFPCKKEWVDEEGFFIDTYDRENRQHFELEIGQVLALNKSAIKGLIVNQKFLEVELLRNLGDDLTDTEFDHWRTAEELYDHHKWVDGKPSYKEVELDNIFMLKSEVNSSKQLSTSPVNNALASNTSLKVIGLLMHHLAKSPKYASGTSPNKSQIKELLLELAVELDVNNYGLSKVDERLLAEAMKYLETQKN